MMHCDDYVAQLRGTGLTYLLLRTTFILLPISATKESTKMVKGCNHKQLTLEVLEELLLDCCLNEKLM
jgi:hypothetical protein